MTLTEAGRRFGERLTPLFDALAEATREAAAVGDVRQLQVSIEPAIASRWLVPRLGRFNELHPDIELAIDPTSKLADFRSGEADVGLRYGAGRLGRRRGAEAHRRGDLSRLRARSSDGPTRASSPAISQTSTCCMKARKQWWADWLAAAGVSGVEDWRGTVFQNHLAIEAAEAGQGFALGDQILCTDSLLEGWLVRPFDLRHEDHWHYWIVRGKGQKETPPVRAFREWVMGEMADTNRKYAQTERRRAARSRCGQGADRLAFRASSHRNRDRRCPPRNMTA